MTLPEHGTNTRYVKFKCRCGDCRRAHARAQNEWKRARAYGKTLLVPALGVSRRLRALAWMGYPRSYLARRYGFRPALLWSLEVGRQVKVTPELDSKIKAVYRDICMVHCPVEVPGSTWARERARANGYVPPLAWEDIDDPEENPTGYAPPPVTYSNPTIARRVLESIEEGSSSS